MEALNKSCYVILGQLSKHDYSGYELKRIIAKKSAFYWSESNAQIYPVLKKLEQQGLVTSSIDASSGARNKRIFSLTSAGKAKVMQWLESDCDVTVHRDEFLLQFSLAQHLSKTKLSRKLQHYQNSITEKLSALNGIIKHLKAEHEGKSDQHYLLLTYDNIRMGLEAKLQWCKKVLKTL